MRKTGWMVLATLVFAGAAPAEIPAGWQVVRDGGACEADYPQGQQGAMLTVVVMPPQHLLLLQNPAFPVEKQSRSITLSFDGEPPLTMESLVSDRITGIAITPEIDAGLRQGSHLTVTVDGKTYEYRFPHAAEAMDEAARCAGTLPQTWTNAPKPIPGVPGWVIFEDMIVTNKCSVRRNGPQLNTTLTLAGDGQLIIVAGWPEWARWSEVIKVKLDLDDKPADELTGGVFQNVVLFPLKDAPDMPARLRAAKTLTWHLPWGDFKGEIDGLAAAETALRACAATNAKR